MATKKLILFTSLIILGIVLLAGGFVYRVLLEKQKIASDDGKIEKMEKIEKTIGSKVITSIVAYGEVSKISGRTVTLTSGAESIEVFIKENAVFLSHVILAVGEKIPETVPQQKEVGFSDIKIGNNLSATIKILPSGGAESVSVVIYLTAAETNS